MMSGVEKTAGSVAGTYKSLESNPPPKGVFTRALKGAGNSSQTNNFAVTNSKEEDVNLRPDPCRSGSQRPPDDKTIYRYSSFEHAASSEKSVTIDEKGNVTISGAQNLHIGNTTLVEVSSTPEKKIAKDLNTQ
nr:hypothetical protein [Erwinia sp. Ejp617]